VEFLEDHSALAVATLALIFTFASFWWLHARRGSIQVATPGAYAFAKRVRLRLPLALYNTGAKALIVSDLRVDVDGARPPLPWQATLTSMRPRQSEARDFATPFAVPGRGTRELVAEFGDDLGWSPAPGTRHKVQIQAKLHPKDRWRSIASFDWWAPPNDEIMDMFIAHRNAPPPILLRAKCGPMRATLERFPAASSGAVPARR
jgi:hypothetical protein